ncbi:1287_t:CDS:2 [Cetraspora pellucida]|uniref:1287_t:CDS:1 n=1 Tax=Cetraspora pellucida TaxID=1433469 RepID=A0ACA9L6K9_9GLOM|nr:1287_t:CDS:2 [Cetraspora pellucida]
MRSGDFENAMNQISTEKSEDYNKIKALSTKFQIEVFLQEFRKKDFESYVGLCVGSLVMWKTSNESIIQAFLKNFDSYIWEFIEVTTIQNNNWDGTIEKPFIPNTLLKITDKDEAKDKDNLFQKLRKIEEKKEDSENKIIQKLQDNEKIIQELKKFLLKEID